MSAAIAHDRVIPFSAHHLLKEVPCETKPDRAASKSCWARALGLVEAKSDDIPATVGDILTSIKQEAETADAYLDHLKSLYGVSEDQELAKALGSTKAAIAKWRRRSAIPAAIQNRVVQRFGPRWFWKLERANFQTRYDQDAYAVCLYLIGRLPALRWEDFPEDHGRNLSLRGAVFAELLKVIRQHIEQNLAGVDSGQPIVERCISDWEAGRITGLDQAVATGWLTQQ